MAPAEARGEAAAEPRRRCRSRPTSWAAFPNALAESRERTGEIDVRTSSRAYERAKQACSLRSPLRPQK